MNAAQPGVLAIWNDCAPEAEAEYEAWYAEEHLWERLAVPGFRAARRYEALRADRRYFTRYDTDAPGVLLSAPYRALLETPTPRTREIMPSFRNMVRAACRVSVVDGRRVDGAHVVTARSAAAGHDPDWRALTGNLVSGGSVARAEVWLALDEGPAQDTREVALRGGADGTIAGALVADCLRRADAERTAAEFAKRWPGAIVGVYTLLCRAYAEVAR